MGLWPCCIYVSLENTNLLRFVPFGGGSWGGDSLVEFCIVRAKLCCGSCGRAPAGKGSGSSFTVGVWQIPRWPVLTWKAAQLWGEPWLAGPASVFSSSFRRLLPGTSDSSCHALRCLGCSYCHCLHCLVLVGRSLLWQASGSCGDGAYFCESCAQCC